MATLYLYFILITGIITTMAGLLYGRYKNASLFKNSIRMIYLDRQRRLGNKIDEAAILEMEQLVPSPLEMTLSFKKLEATVWLSSDEIEYLFN